METWKNYGEHGLRLIQGVDDWRTISMFAMLVALVGIAFWYRSPWYAERAVSRRKMKTRHRKVKEISAQKITEALEMAHVKGELKRTEVDHMYKIIGESTGIRDLGIEPTFGRPWYKPASMPDFNKLKQEITNRLHKMQVDIVSKLKRSTPAVKSKKELVLAALKKS